MPTVPRSVKTAFHVFGIVSFTVGASFCINTWLSIDSCVSITKTEIHMYSRPSVARTLMAR